MNLRRWFAERSIAARVVLLVAAVVVAVNAALYAVRVVAAGGEPGGATGSAHATAADGYAGWADLLARSGRKVVLLDRHLADTDLAPGATVIVAEPEELTADDGTALDLVLKAGGRVVLTGSFSTWLVGVAGVSSIGWSPVQGGRAGVLAPSPEVNGVTVVEAGEGRFHDIGPLLPILGSKAGALAAVGDIGPGRVVVVASTEVFDNAHLDHLDNAVFALGVTGGRDSPVYFDEADHGYGPSSGLSALPSGWKWTAAGAVLAALVALWSRGKRFGPPEDAERELAPPRRQHVDALTAALARSRDYAGTGHRLWASVRAQLSRTAGIAVDDPRFDAAARDRAAAAGVPDAELATLVAAPEDKVGLVALGSVAARLSRARTDHTARRIDNAPPGGSL